MKKFTFCLLCCGLIAGYAEAQSSVNPYQTIQAEAYDGQSGIRLSNNGTAVGYIQDGDYLYFDNLNFGNEGAAGLTIRAASNTSGGQIEYRLGSPTGDLVGAVDIPNTGGWSSFEYFTVNNTAGIIYGTQTIYLVFKGGSGYLLDLDQLVFSTEVVATGLSISNCPTQIELGTTYDFDVTITPSNTTNQTVAFTASGGTGVDYLSGEYTATSLGTKTVYVTSFSDGSLGDQCTFEVVAPSSTNPYQTIQAEDYDDQNGVRLSNGGTAVGYIQDGDYIGFNNLDFGNEGGKSITVWASSNTNGGTIEYRLGSPTGDLVGTVDIPNTGGWTSFESFTVNNTAGFIYNTVDIYLVFRGGSGFLLDIDRFSFSTEVFATGISITNCPTQIELGATYDFDAEIFPFTTTDQFVQFTTSSGTGINTVSGEYIATSLGTKTVTVTSFSEAAEGGFVSDQCIFEVVESTSARTGTPYEKDLAKSELEEGLLRVYPNPSNGNFSLQLSESSSVRITDLQGREVYGRALSPGRHQLNLSAYEAGMYILSAGSHQQLKLILE